MTRLLLYKLMISLCSNLVAKLGIIIVWKIHQEDVTSKYGINKDKPMFKCNGKCHLMKQLKKLDQGEQSAADRSPQGSKQSFKPDILFNESFDRFKLDNYSSFVSERCIIDTLVAVDSKGNFNTNFTVTESIDEHGMLICTYVSTKGECPSTAANCVAARAAFLACMCDKGYKHLCPDAFIGG